MLRLFILLAVATAIVMVLYLRTPAAATVRRRLAFATAGDLATPVAAWFILKAIPAWKTPARNRVLLQGLLWTGAAWVAAFAALVALGLATNA